MTGQVGLIVAVLAFTTTTADAAPMCKAANGQLIQCGGATVVIKKSMMPYTSLGNSNGSGVGSVPQPGWGGGGGPQPGWGGGGGPQPGWGGGGGSQPGWGGGGGPQPGWGGGGSVTAEGTTPLASVCLTDYGTCYLVAQQYIGDRCFCGDGGGNAIPGVTN
jgi:hypothetical protein